MKNVLEISQLDNNQYQKLPIQIQNRSYTFKITQEIVQQTGKSIQQIKHIILKYQEFDWYFIKSQEEQQTDKIILIKCLHKLKQSSVSFSCHKQFPMNIIKQLTHVIFLNIKYLGLSSCNINNLQDFQFLSFPTIQTLQLYGNRIVQIGGITKNFNMRILNTLTLYGNLISQISKISRAHFQRLQYIELDILKNYKKPIVQNLLFIAKLQGKIKTNRQTRLWAACSKRIQQYIRPQTLQKINCYIR